ncbi:MAG: hypothetical protein R2822_07205 [Spirosomataceae bacterium]
MKQTLQFRKLLLGTMMMALLSMQTFAQGITVKGKVPQKQMEQLCLVYLYY